MVSPESTCSTGGWALLNQPHWVVSMVAGSTCVLPGRRLARTVRSASCAGVEAGAIGAGAGCAAGGDRKSTRLNSSHVAISYAVFCLKKKKVKDRRGGRR